MYELQKVSNEMSFEMVQIFEGGVNIATEVISVVLFREKIGLYIQPALEIKRWNILP